MYELSEDYEIDKYQYNGSIYYIPNIEYVDVINNGGKVLRKLKTRKDVRAAIIMSKILA